MLHQVEVKSLGASANGKQQGKGQGDKCHQEKGDKCQQEKSPNKLPNAASHKTTEGELKQKEKQDNTTMMSKTVESIGNIALRTILKVVIKN